MVLCLWARTSPPGACRTSRHTTGSRTSPSSSGSPRAPWCASGTMPYAGRSHPGNELHVLGEPTSQGCIPQYRRARLWWSPRCQSGRVYVQSISPRQPDRPSDGWLPGQVLQYLPWHKGSSGSSSRSSSSSVTDGTTVFNEGTQQHLLEWIPVLTSCQPQLRGLMRNVSGTASINEH